MPFPSSPANNQVAIVNGITYTYSSTNNSWTRVPAFNTSNIAFNQANTAFGQANAAFNQANTAFGQANTAYNQANTSFGQANTAFNTANGAVLIGTSSGVFANGAFTVANSASSNTITTQGVDVTQNTNITNAQSFANGAFVTANSAASFANGAFNTANLAYSTANTGYNFVTTGGVIGGPVTINGNFTVNGTQTIVNSSTATYNNPYIILHAANTGYLTVDDGNDIGIDFEYYTQNTVEPRIVLSGTANGTYAVLNLTDNTYFAPNNTVTIAGVTPSNFNGTFLVTGSQPGQITYALAYTGTVTATSGTTLGTVSRKTQVTITGGSTVSGSKISTVTFTPAITLAVGSTVTITGCTPAGYNGTWTVTASSAGSISFQNISNLGTITVNGLITTDNRRGFFGRSDDTGAFEFYKVGQWYNGSFEGVYGEIKAAKFLASPAQSNKYTDITGGFIGTQTSLIYDTSSSANAVNPQQATANLSIFTIASANTNVAYQGASTLRIQGAPVAGNNISFTGNVYALQVDAGGSFFGGGISVNSQGITFNDGSIQTTNAATYAYSVSGYNQANSAASFANGAFLVANSAASFANGAFVMANSGYGVANSGSSFANGAFVTANSAASFANGAFLVANSAASFANGAFTQANSGYGVANSGSSFANGAFVTANSAASFANGAFLVANGAAFVANTDYTNISISTGTYGNSSIIPVITVAANGRITSIANVASSGGGGGSISITDETTNSSTYYPLLGTVTSGTLSTANTSSTKLYYVPSTGTLSVTNFNSLSDQSKKENISTINYALNKVMSMRGVSYTWKDTKQPSIGLIAQELEYILPELVQTNDKGEKSVSYGNIVGVLIEAIKEQQKMIDEQEKRIKALENE